MDEVLGEVDVVVQVKLAQLGLEEERGEDVRRLLRGLDKALSILWTPMQTPRL